MANTIDPALILRTTPPKLRRSLLARERLRAIRVQGEDVPVFLVEAPAGHGKTSLLAQWRLDWMQAGAVVSWLSLSSEDTPITVVSGIVTGLRRGSGEPRFGVDALEAVRSGAGAAAALTSLLADIAEAAKPLVLMFDNFERIGASPAQEVFEYLLHNLPPNLQIVLGSRPPAPLATWPLLGQGSLRQVTTAELRFDLSETIRLLTAHLGERVSADDCARLHEVTEGWPLGLQLAATALERAADPARAMQAFTATGDDATRQLFDGMLHALPPHLAGFLTRCALLDALHPALCEAATGEEDAGLFLQRLLAETPLLTATEGGEWLRLHPLVRQYLRQRAERELAEPERRELHVRAWQWLAAHGLPERAAQHALAADHPDEALGLVTAVLEEQFEQGHHGAVAEWLMRVPAEEKNRSPSLRLLSIWMALLSGKAEEVPEMARALAGDPDVEASIRAEAEIAMGIAHGFSDEMDQFEEYVSRYVEARLHERARRVVAGDQAVALVSRGETESARRLIRSLPHDGRIPVVEFFDDYFHSLSYMWEGRPALAEHVARPVHAAWVERAGRRGQWTCMIGGMLARACWQQNLPAEARALLANRLDVIEQFGLPETTSETQRTLARMAIAEGDEPRAFVHLESLAAIGEQQGIARLLIVSLAERVRLHATRGRRDQAASLLDDLDAVFERYPIAKVVEPLLRLEMELAQTYSALVNDEPDRAGTHAESAWGYARRLNRGYESVQILALQALLAERQGTPFAGVITEALSRAESGGLVRVFADTLPEVIELIRRVMQDGGYAPVSRAFVERVLAAANVSTEMTTPAASMSAAGSAILTPKESEVLKLLAGGLPNKRIATELALSAETVKWHVKKLFAKLGAGSRGHAVERARMLGLLS